MLNPVVADYLKPLYKLIRERYGSFRYEVLSKIGVVIDWILFKDCPVYLKEQVDRIDSIMDVKGPVEIANELEKKGVSFEDFPEAFGAYFFRVRWPREKPEVLTAFYDDLVDFLVEQDDVFVDFKNFKELIEDYAQQSDWIKLKASSCPKAILEFTRHWFGDLEPVKLETTVYVPPSISPRGIDWEKLNQLASKL